MEPNPNNFRVIRKVRRVIIPLLPIKEAKEASLRRVYPSVCRKHNTVRQRCVISLTVAMTLPPFLPLGNAGLEDTSGPRQQQVISNIINFA